MVMEAWGHGQESGTHSSTARPQQATDSALVLAAADVERVFARAKAAARQTRPSRSGAASPAAPAGAIEASPITAPPARVKPISLLGGKRLMNASIAWARLSLPAEAIAAALGNAPIGLWEEGPSAADCERLLAGGLPSDAEAVLLGTHDTSKAPLEPCETRIRHIVLAAAASGASTEDGAVATPAPGMMREAASRLRWSASAVVFAAEDQDLLRRVKGPSSAAVQGLQAAVESRGVVRLLGALLALGNVAQRGSQAVGERGLAVKAFDVAGAAEAARSCGFDGRTRAVDLLWATSKPPPATNSKDGPSTTSKALASAPLMPPGEALALAGVLESAAAVDMDSVRGAHRRLQEGSRLLGQAVRAAHGRAVPGKLASAAARALSAVAEADAAVSAAEAAAARCSAFFGVPGADASLILRGLAGLLRCWAEQPLPAA